MNILCLDGGGSKGVYTIGILKELEALIDKPLHKHFDLVYGTSTGSIIAAMIGLGHSVIEIEKLYSSLVPEIMGQRSSKRKSAVLKAKLDEFFGEKKFDEFKIGVSIVSTNYYQEKPFIFKRDVNHAYRLKNTFVPGFGVPIATAIQASCAATPFFEKVLVETINQGEITAVDGGFIANNPTLFAITDVTQSIELPPDQIAILSLGTGNFVEKKMKGIKSWFVSKVEFVQLFERMLKANTNTTEILTKLNFKNIPLVRINETFNQPEYGTNFLEDDKEKLKLLFQLGRNSFGTKEEEIKALFQL